MMKRFHPKLIAAIAIPLLLILAIVVPSLANGTRTVTAEFPQAISVFPGTDVTVMGVSVGRVKEVTPAGDHVKVVIEYDDQYRLPADVKAAIITPTLVADRFVQLVPAYDGGPELPDGAVLPRERSIVPMEMDRIYQSLTELTEVLGPQGANADGALGELLSVAADSLEGNGAIGHDAIENLGAAARTLGANSEDLFATIGQLAAVTKTLESEDATVREFMGKLSAVSTQLAGEGKELEQALAAIAHAVGVTEGFVRENKDLLIKDLRKVNRTLRTIVKYRDSLATVIQLAPLGMGNLAVGFDTPTGSQGIRLQLGPTVSDLGNILCAFVNRAGITAPEAVCSVLQALVQPVGGPATDLLSGFGRLPTGSAPPADAPRSGGPTPASPILPDAPTDVKSLVGQLTGLLGGNR